MNCATLRRELLAGRWPAGPEAEAHLATCETCAEELARRSEAGWAARGLEPEVESAALDPLFAEVARATESDRGALGWLRSRPTPTRRALGVSAGLAVVVACLALLPRVDLPLYPAARMSLELGAVLALAATAVGLALRPLSRPALPRWVPASIALAGLAVAAAIASATPAHAHHPASLVGVGADFGGRALGCLGFGAAASLAPLGWLLALDRRGARDLGPALLLAAGASLVGFAALEVHCPLVHREHLWAGHVTVLGLICAVGLGASRLRSRRG